MKSRSLCGRRCRSSLEKASSIVSGISFISSFVTRSARDAIWLIAFFQSVEEIALIVIEVV